MAHRCSAVMLKHDLNITMGKVGAILAAGITMVYCSFYITLSSIFVFVVTSSYINEMIYVSNPGSNFLVMGVASVSLVNGWLVFLITIFLARPQCASAWNLLRTIKLLAVTSITAQGEAAVLSLDLTRKSLALQTKILLVEAIFNFLCCVFLRYFPLPIDNSTFSLLFTLLSTIIIGRLACIILIQVHIIEQQRRVIHAGVRNLCIPIEFSEKINTKKTGHVVSLTIVETKKDAKLGNIV